MKRTGCLASIGLLASLLAWGCNLSDESSPDLAPLRSKYLLSEEPADALGVADALEAIDQQLEIVLVGQIPASPDPWTKGRALFLLADPGSCVVDESHEPHACGDGCPYCSKNNTSATESLAVVQFLDEQGRVLPHDARQLFGVAADQVVVVRGQAKVDELGRLVVSASGIYIRR